MPPAMAIIPNARPNSDDPPFCVKNKYHAGVKMPIDAYTIADAIINFCNFSHKNNGR